MNRPPALGLGSIRGLKETKDIEPSQQNEGVLPQIKRRTEKKKESFSSKKNGSLETATVEEELLISPTHEKDADMVRYRAVTNEPEPEIWQKVACVWDQCQTRPNQFHQYESDRQFPAISTSIPRFRNEEDDESEKKSKRLEEPAKIVIPTMTEGTQIRFTRPTPGYGGYVSRYPVEPRAPQGSWDEVFVNFSKLTYRAYPPYEYTAKEFSHKGPLSRLVTTSHPSNPFNKVDQWNSRPKKLWRRRNHLKFVIQQSSIKT
ncbi:protein SPMIP7-like [Montipora capricornis]|uniref:protein SPMIP7-like n=1 Tax=Montipora capricornis TaxID=246305 RepID=UPI0035F1692C